MGSISAPSARRTILSHRPSEKEPGLDESVETFVRQQNLDNFKRQIEAATDPIQRKMLLTLLAEEEAKAAEARSGPPV